MDHSEGGRKREGKANGRFLKVLEFAAAIVGAFALLRTAGREKPEGRDVQQEVAGERHFKRQVLQGWVIVCAISVAFVLYGLFALFVVGDKGPPDWDFGAVEDVPGQSPYSTYPYEGGMPDPEPQHVYEKPASAAKGIPAGQRPSIPQKGME